MNKDEDTTENKLIKEEEKIEKSIFKEIHKYFHTHLSQLFIQKYQLMRTLYFQEYSYFSYY